MAEINTAIKKNSLYWSLLISAAVHFLLLFFLVERGKFVFFSADSAESGEKERPIAFEIVETSEGARIPEQPQETALLSDKNARAQDMAADDLPVSDLPYSKGVSEVKEIPSTPSNRAAPPVFPADEGHQSVSAEKEQGAGREQTVQSLLSRRSTASDFRSSLLFGSAAQARSSSYRQDTSSAANTGGMSFNTYEWEFAPYMLQLKERIQKNIFPPAAFTRLGFGGKNVIRFRIYPDGRLEGPEVLRMEGEQALVETSRKAVQYSAPFLPLPADFPEEFLEVTARFEYFIVH